jgi:hypothetical protein
MARGRPLTRASRRRLYIRLMSGGARDGFVFGVLLTSLFGSITFSLLRVF